MLVRMPCCASPEREHARGGLLGLVDESVLADE